MNEKNRNIFYVVVAIATLIVAIVGATLAYFSIYASSNENVVAVRAKEVKIDYTDSQRIWVDDIIPASFNVVETSFLHPIAESQEGLGDGREICEDDQGYAVCTANEFIITNSGSAADMEFYLEIKENEFDNLRYILYYKENEQDPYVNVYGRVADGGLGILDGQNDKSLPVIQRETEESDPKTTISLLGEGENTVNKFHFDPGDEYIFSLVMYLDNQNEEQNHEQGNSFAGTIKVQFGEQIKGRISRSGN